MTNDFKHSKYPVLEVDVAAVENNAWSMCSFCKARGINVAGVVKFSDANLEISGAYHRGGCSQIASSRTVHLREIKETYPDVQTMLIRIPMISEIKDVVLFCDISLNSEESVLKKLNEEAGTQGKVHGVILMYDVAERREGIIGADELCRLALLVENELANLKLMGIGSSFACVSGVLPDYDNLTVLAEGAKFIEEKIGRKLDIVSGGSTVTLPMFKDGKMLPPGINHLRIGGGIANPINLRTNLGLSIDGMREDAFKLIGEVVEAMEKPAPVGGSGKNWAGQEVHFENSGSRKRVIIALGSQDIGDVSGLIPLDEGVQLIGCSSDHTILDATDSPIDFKPGDKMTFRLYYMSLLYSFSTRHVNIVYK